MISQAIFDVCVRQSEKIGVFGHGFTYSGHPVCAAVAIETLKIYDEMDIVGHVRSVAPALQTGLRRDADHPLVGEVRGLGLVSGLELVRNKASREPFAPELNWACSSSGDARTAERFARTWGHADGRAAAGG